AALRGACLGADSDGQSGSEVGRRSRARSRDRRRQGSEHHGRTRDLEENQTRGSRARVHPLLPVRRSNGDSTRGRPRGADAAGSGCTMAAAADGGIRRDLRPSARERHQRGGLFAGPPGGRNAHPAPLRAVTRGARPAGRAHRGRPGRRSSGVARAHAGEGPALMSTKPVFARMPATRAQRHRRIAFWFLLPNLIGFGLFTAWPVLAALALAFCSWDLLTPPRWVGLSNFVQLLGFRHVTGEWIPNDPGFWRYLGNTLFMMLNLPVNLLGSLGLAMLLNRKLRGIHLYRLVYFLPSILAGVPIYYLWRWIYNPDHGLLNSLLALVGIDGPDWLGSAAWAKPALMLM